MPADDYTAAVSGGLKLKNVSLSSKVSKSHKKKRPKSSQPESTGDANVEKFKDEIRDNGEGFKNCQDDIAIKDKNNYPVEDGGVKSSLRAGKTEAEVRHEERRRRRVPYSHILLLASYLECDFD